MYGSHPFYLVQEEDGLAHGVFLLNSNAMGTQHPFSVECQCFTTSIIHLGELFDATLGSILNL